MDAQAGWRAMAVSRTRGGERCGESEAVVVERPLQLVINQRPVLTTMRTPGDERALVLGYLLSEGLLGAQTEVRAWSLQTQGELDVACLTASPLPPEALDKLRRVGASVSSCGVCGRAEALSFLPSSPTPLAPLRVAPSRLPAMLAAMRAQQPLFAQTGGLHAAALFGPDEAPLCVREDIGRHNAIDKALGWWWEAGRPGEGALALVSSGRASYEVAQKAAAAGIGTLISVSAASSMAVDIARALGMLLIGFVRGDEAVIYHDPSPGPSPGRGYHPGHPLHAVEGGVGVDDA
jgi:FdhD protein